MIKGHKILKEEKGGGGHPGEPRGTVACWERGGGKE